MAQGDRVEPSIGLADSETGGFAGFDFIEDAEIDVFEGGCNDSRKALTVLADDINAGLHPGLLRSSQKTGGPSAEFGVRFIESVEQQ